MLCWGTLSGASELRQKLRLKRRVWLTLGRRGLKEEITPGGIHPETLRGLKANQSGSKKGREEGNGAQQEMFQLLL